MIVLLKITAKLLELMTYLLHTTVTVSNYETHAPSNNESNYGQNMQSIVTYATGMYVLSAI